MPVITTPRPLRAVSGWARRVDAAIAAGGAGNAAEAIREIDELHLTWQRDVAAADERLGVLPADEPAVIDLAPGQLTEAVGSVDVRG